MKYHFTAKNINLTDALKERIISKLSKLEKLFPESTEVYVTCNTLKHQQTIEVTIPLQKRILRTEVTTDDMFASIDETVDKLEKQLLKYKNRLQKRVRKDVAFKPEFDNLFKEAAANDEQHPTIEKIKKFALKPMDAEEAVMEMDLLGHSFYVFRNSKTEEVNVVYKRKDGAYGLIEPEF